MKELRAFESLAALLETARSGSPITAARTLGRAPSSVYRAIERLELDVGSPLFQRAASGWSPTKAGRELVQLSEHIESRIREAELALLRRNQRFPTPLRISASDGFASYLAPHLATFAEQQHDVLIELSVDNTFVDLVRREADIAIRPDQRPGDGVVGQRAGKLVHALYGSRRLLEQGGMPTSTQDLSRYRLCLLTASLPHFTAATWWTALEIPDTPKVSFIANTETALAAAIVGGAGIGVLPRFLGDRLDGIIRVPAIVIGEPVDIWLVAHSVMRKNTIVRALIRFLATAIRKDARLFEGRDK